MAEHKITLNWAKGDVPFTYDVYPRNHQIAFKNGEARPYLGRGWSHDEAGFVVLATLFADLNRIAIGVAREQRVGSGSCPPEANDAEHGSAASFDPWRTSPAIGTRR